VISNRTTAFADKLKRKHYPPFLPFSIVTIIHFNSNSSLRKILRPKLDMPEQEFAQIYRIPVLRSQERVRPIKKKIPGGPFPSRGGTITQIGGV
jgi:hypothetical protein